MTRKASPPSSWSRSRQSSGPGPPAGRVPTFVDLESGGSVLGLIQDVDAIVKRLPPDVTIIPGHGPLSKLDDLKRYHRMLVETTDIVRQRVKAGKTLEQIQAEGLSDEWKEWGSGFIDAKQWLATIHASLAEGMPQGMPADDHRP